MITTLTEKTKTLETEIEEIDEEKRLEIKELNIHITEVEASFKEMLAKTLEKMKTKIERANSEWQKEVDLVTTAKLAMEAEHASFITEGNI